jgi:hypothetical protein
MLTLLQQPSNAAIVRAEIDAVQGKYGRWKTDPRMPDVPCPYIALLLAVAWKVDLEDPECAYVHEASFSGSALPADMGTRDGGA